jgi:glycosyltransferase involved in cell wall biosynthesis
MRIALVSSTWTTHRRSARENTCEIRAQELASLGHEVHAITTGDPQVGVRQDFDGLAVHHCEGQPGRWSGRFAEECRAICEAIKPDILHLEDFEPTLRWWESRPGCVRRIGCTLHESLLGWLKTIDALYAHDKIRRIPSELVGDARLRAELAAVLSFDHVAVTCRKDLMDGEQYYPGAKLALVYNPVGSRFFRPRSDKMPQRPCFLVASSPFTHRHGHRDAERAGELAGYAVQVVAGSGPNKVPGLLDASTGAIVPSYQTWGLSMSACEALARCRPAIVYAGTGIAYEEFRGLEGLVVVNPGDIEAMAAAMQLWMPRVEYGVADRFRPEIHTTKWLELMES